MRGAGCGLTNQDGPSGCAAVVLVVLYSLRVAAKVMKG